MAVTTNQPARLRIRLNGKSLPGALLAILQAAAIFVLAQHHGWWPAAMVLVAAELWPAMGAGRREAKARRAEVLARVPAILMGASVVLIIALAPRLATQVVVAVLYAGWRMWWRQAGSEAAGLMNLLLVQAAVFEAVFLMAAIWRLPLWSILTLVWLVAYGSVYAGLKRRSERAAGIMAATWGLICMQISWILLTWLFTYAMSGGYVLVPQPALILTALAYCFGSIYVSQRQGNLSRGRLTEYLVIGLIMIAIVAIGTSWRGTV